MPELSRFEGMVIKMLFNDTVQHNKPHIHVKYNEYEASLSLDGTVINGNLPLKQLRLVQAWMEIHNDELIATWYCYNNDGEILKIKGLE